MTISLRLNKEDSAIIKNFAEAKKMSVSELLRQSVMERIEDEIDLSLYEKAIKEYHENPVSYSLDEIESELGL